MYRDFLALNFDENGDLKTGQYEIFLPPAIVIGVDRFEYPNLFLNWTCKFASGSLVSRHIIFLNDVFCPDSDAAYIGEMECGNKKYFVCHKAVR